MHGILMEGNEKINHIWCRGFIELSHKLRPRTLNQAGSFVNAATAFERVVESSIELEKAVQVVENAMNKAKACKQQT